MKKIMYEAMVILTLLTVSAQTMQASLTEQETLALISLDTNELKKVLTKINNKLMEQLEEKNAFSEKIVRNTIEINIFVTHPFVEADTGFSKRWYKAMDDALNGMIETKTKQKMAWINKNAPDFAKYNKIFEKQVSDFAELSSKPVRVERERLVILRKDARSKRDEIEKKLEKIEREERRSERAGK